MRRVIVYGDIHGCVDEWVELRSQLSPDPDDTEIAVGDLLDRGPESLACLRLARGNRILCVRGNHEHVYARYARHEETRASIGKKNPMDLSPEKIDFFASMTEEDKIWLQDLPLFIRMGNLTVVHGGVLPRVELNSKTPRHIAEISLWIRNLDNRENPVGLGDPRSLVRWSDRYSGASGFVVYGHEAFRKPRISSNSLGIDTGCVFGGSLTAAVFELDGDGLPTPDYRLVSTDCGKKGGYARSADFQTAC